MGVWWLIGFVSFPVLALTILAVASATEPGLEIHCGRCRYRTGDMRTTARFVTHVRWFWHKRIAHPLGLVKT